jgi:hypothetical protein
MYIKTGKNQLLGILFFYRGQQPVMLFCGSNGYYGLAGKG